MIRIFTFLILFFSFHVLLGQGKITRPQKHPNKTSQLSSEQGRLEKDTIKIEINQPDDTPILSNKQKNINWSVFRPSSVSYTAPELNCSVEFNTDLVQYPDKSVFHALKTDIATYMNNTTFTDANFCEDERIHSTLSFTIKNYDNSGLCTCDVLVRSLRPVFGSTYASPVLCFEASNIIFKYRSQTPLVISKESDNRQLTTILNFYAYLIIANDFDTFALNGGNQFWEKLNHIIQTAKNSNDKFLVDFGYGHNHEALLRNSDTAENKLMREFSYTYHRKGLDEMSRNPTMARKNITESLSLLKKVSNTNQQSVSLLMLSDSKIDELLKIYNNASSEERIQAYALLQSIFPTNTILLERLKFGHR